MKYDYETHVQFDVIGVPTIDLGVVNEEGVEQFDEIVKLRKIRYTAPIAILVLISVVSSYFYYQTYDGALLSETETEINSDQLQVAQKEQPHLISELQKPDSTQLKEENKVQLKQAQGEGTTKTVPVMSDYGNGSNPDNITPEELNEINKLFADVKFKNSNISTVDKKTNSRDLLSLEEQIILNRNLYIDSKPRSHDIPSDLNSTVPEVAANTEQPAPPIATGQADLTVNLGKFFPVEQLSENGTSNGFLSLGTEEIDAILALHDTPPLIEDNTPSPVSQPESSEDNESTFSQPQAVLGIGIFPSNSTADVPITSFTESVFDSENEQSVELSASENTPSIEPDSAFVSEIANGDTVLDDSSVVRLAWLDEFEGPSLDLNRFITPSSRIAVEDGVMTLSLSAIHAEISEDVELEQSIALQPAAKLIDVQLSLNDSSATNHQGAVSPSTFSMTLPLEVLDQGSTRNVDDEFIARLKIESNPTRKEHSVTLGAYKQVPSDDDKNNLYTSLGQTSFIINSTNAELLSEGKEIFSFSLDANYDQLKLSINDNEISIPINVRLSTVNPNAVFELSAAGGVGDYSQIEVAVEKLTVDGQTITSLRNNSDVNDAEIAPENIAGYALEVNDGYARLRIGGVDNNSRVLLATRSELTIADWAREIQTSKYSTEITVRDSAENRSHGAGNKNDSSESVISMVFALFEISTPLVNQLIFAELQIKPVKETISGLTLVEVSAKIARANLFSQEYFNWHSIWKNAEIIAETPMNVSRSTLANIPVEIQLIENHVSFSWGGESVDLLHNYDTRWFPSAPSDSAVLVESAHEDQLSMEFDYIGVYRNSDE